MNTPISWIKVYVPDLNCTDQEFRDAMTLSGTKVENFEKLDKNLDKIVVGQVKKIDRHPDADKLIVCQVDVGTETLQIVTGAPNVVEGGKYPVVLHGGKVAGGHDGGPLPENGIRITKGKLRGVDSFGMMCSIEELGSDRNFYPEAPESGIYPLPDDAEVGSDAIELLGLRDTVFEYEITSNRVDCYSVMGIAREAAATFNLKFNAPEVKATGNSEKAEDYLSVEVKDTELCPRFCARVVKNIKIGPSPWWMQRRLANCGIRPINNIVDITNYVMEEFGQPMHAYDYDMIAGHKIIVRRAGDGDRFVTLDGQERTLDNNILMICDGEKEIGMAGIMGGENSMITDDVKTMVFEAACFDGTNIRLSAKKVGLRTEASGKFEKGLDPETAKAAIDRACELVEQLGCGEVVGGCIDVYPDPVKESRVKLDSDAVNNLLGTSLTKEQMIEYLARVELKYDEATGDIVAPTWRQDIHWQADLAEEVARFFGYDRIPTTLPKGRATTGGISFAHEVEDVARETAMFLGFSEGMSFSFESPKVFDMLMIPEDDPARRAIRIMNPLGEDFSIMRTAPLHGLISSLATNYKRKNADVRLFELANIYIPKELPLRELPDERMQLALGFYGDGDFYVMKGVVEELFEKLGMKDKIHYDPKAERPYLHPGRKADIIYNGSNLGYLGEIHPQVLDNYGIEDRAYAAVIDMPAVMKFASFDIKYTGIANYPAVTRDVSVVVARDLPVGAIEECIEKAGKGILESYALFDLFESDKLGEGVKSVAYTMTFRRKDRTLEDKEVNEVMEKVFAGLEKIGAKLRV
ncbi:MAG: phenylalanine--tRNA ligase subunit beta [Lachnospiraceae bacterium]|nr:phenylalanine--tRNA ligase subunit beta [Candidatus Darwinimomas equi]